MKGVISNEDIDYVPNSISSCHMTRFSSVRCVSSNVISGGVDSNLQNN
jgi:hypothetical protein